MNAINPIPQATTLKEADAISRIKDFRDNILGLDDWPAGVSKTYACHVSEEDINGLLNMTPKPTGVRCYLSLSYNQDLNKKVISLVLVGTKEVNGKNVDILNQENGFSAIFDFTTPCPDTCDGGSALNNAS